MHAIRNFSRGCLALLMLYGALAAAAPTASFSATVSGSTQHLNLTAHYRVADADLGRAGRYYLAFLYQNQWNFNNGTTWQTWSGGALPSVADAVLADRSSVVASDLDASTVVGGQLYLGYGLSESDMLSQGKYALVYTITAPQPGLAPVLLGTAGNFVILAKTGISTVPTSVITGDIGVSPAAASYLTGFALSADAGNTFATATQVVGGGRVYAADYAPPTPANLTTAVLDMQTAYSDAAGRPTPVSNLGGGTIGGLTFAPGLYQWGSSVLITRDITLAGSADDVWIFQIAGDLLVDSAQRVLLSGGAQAKNIFWQVAGQATLGTTAHLEGNILSQTSITLQTGASMNGRALAQTMVALDSATLTRPAP